MTAKREMTIYFVLPSHCDDELSTSEEMQSAFDLCRQHTLVPEWISEQSCHSKEFHREDIIVFEKFEGETFQKVKTRLSIVGPSCLNTCLLEGLKVPNNKSPIFNMAMYKLTVTASNLSVDQKKNMKEKIEMMGGVFSLHFTSSVTHLITNSVRTQKYLVANAKGVEIMVDSWVEDVWNCNLTRKVKATDEEFKKHKCPCLLNLKVCSTGFEMSERSELQRIVTENGGIYSGKLLTQGTDILFCKPGTKSEKFDVAKKAKIPCVRIEWLHDSIKKGFAQSEDEYIIKVASSTPTKNDAPLNPDFSMMSIISGNEYNDPLKTSVSETINVSSYNMSTPQTRKPRQQKENEEPDVVTQIDLQAVRKAGTFLDGCGILLAGFSPERRDKLVRILRSSGATRYETLSDRVTQVVVGDPAAHEVRLFKGKAPLVSAGWIQESINRGQPAPEEDYIINTGAQTAVATTPSSPLSKKGLTLLQNDTSTIEPEPVQQLEPEEHDNLKIYKTNQTEQDTLAHLLAQGDINSKCDTNKTNNTDLNEDEDLFFKGKTFKLIEHDDEDFEILAKIIEKRGGKLISNKSRKVADYAIVPPISETGRESATEILNLYWLQECDTTNEIVPIKYYHQPLSVVQNANLLNDCVITISGYVLYERMFLRNLIEELGATHQEKFARLKIDASNVLKSTHLVCKEAQGSKYLAALKWERYAVTHEWLLRCAETGQRLPEEQFLRKDIDPEEDNTLIKSHIVPKKNEAEKVPLIAAPEVLREPESFFNTPCRNKRISPSASDSPESGSSKRLKTQEKESFQAPLSKDKNVEITTEDNQVLPLNSYMNDLRAQGVFDTPSPVNLQRTGTDIPAKQLQEGSTPTRKNHGEIAASQGTPVGRYIRGLQERNVLPSSPKLGNSFSTDSPRPVFDVSTPEEPLGRFMGEDDPSRSTRKQWLRCLSNIPHYPLHERPTPPPRRPSTPWSEFKRQAWSQLYENVAPNSPQVAESENVVTETQQEISNKIDQLQDELRRRESIGTSRSVVLRNGSSTSAVVLRNGSSTSTDKTTTDNDAKDSQTDTVGWDEPLEHGVFSESTGINSAPRKFMMSAIQPADRTNIQNIICSLGGEISTLNSYDSTATHVVCCNAAKNEKILASMAAGLWIVHQSYIEQSGAAGRFLSEENYELGNPMAQANIASLMKPSSHTDAIHWWRKRVAETGKGAFHGMRAIIFSATEQAAIRILEAGHGTVVRASPPFDHNIDATHCLIDSKLKLDYSDFIPLAKQGIPCLNILYLANFLGSQTNINLRDFIIPELKKYYNYSFSD